MSEACFPVPPSNYAALASLHQDLTLQHQRLLVAYDKLEKRYDRLVAAMPMPRIHFRAGVQPECDAVDEVAYIEIDAIRFCHPLPISASYHTLWKVELYKATLAEWTRRVDEELKRTLELTHAQINKEPKDEQV